MKNTKKLSEVKITRRERRVVGGGSKAHKDAVKSFHRATRRAAKKATQNYYRILA